jgi:hypothetical protein
MQIPLLALIGLVVFQDTRAADCMQCATISNIIIDEERPLAGGATALVDALDGLAYFSAVSGMEKCPVMAASSCSAGDYCVSVSNLVTWTDGSGNLVTQQVDVMGCQTDLLDHLEAIQQALTESEAPLDWSTEADDAATCAAIQAAMCHGLDNFLDGGSIFQEVECTVVCGDAQSLIVYSRIQTVQIEMTYDTYTAAQPLKRRAVGDIMEDVAGTYEGAMEAACVDIEGFLYSILMEVEEEADEDDVTFYTFRFDLYFSDAVDVDEDEVIAAVDVIVTADREGDDQGAAFDSRTGINVVMSEQQMCDADASCYKDGATRNSVAAFVLVSTLIAAL